MNELSESRNALYDPFRDLYDIGTSFWRDPFPFWSGARRFGFNTDVIDAGESYRIEAELPGFSRSDIDIDVSGDTLTLKANRKWDGSGKKDRYVHSERGYGSFTRSFDISGVRSDDISASYEDGVLKITMPKKSTEQTKSRKLNIQ